MKTFKPLLIFSFLLTILALQIKCAKTDDVKPIVSNNNSNNDSTNNDSTSVTIADDTVYINSIISGFILNEVLYDPPGGGPGDTDNGDANNDGIRDPFEDEFVEFVNTSNSCINISGCKIFDEENLISNIPNHVFPDSTFINPNQAVVVFGGGDTVGPFGGALVFISSNVVLDLQNGSSSGPGDKITFTDSSGNILIEFDIDPLSNNPNESYTRDPDLTGLFVQHNSVSGTLFSPGTRTDGTPF